MRTSGTTSSALRQERHAPWMREYRRPLRFFVGTAF
jgi:hypothetical protein